MGAVKAEMSIKFIEEIEEYSFPEAVRVLAEEAGIPVTWSGQQDKQSLG